MTGDAPIWVRRPGADAISPAAGTPAVDLGDGLWASAGLSNSYLVTTDDERVVINTGMGFEGPLHRAAFDAVDRSPTSHVILTQGHYDHVGGVDSFLEEGTDVVAQAAFTTWRDDNERLEAFRSRNAAFAWIDAIVAAMSHAAEHTGTTPAQSRPDPTVVVEHELDLEIGGRHLRLLSTPGGETTDSLVVWFPDERTALTGNLLGPLFGHVPNLVTIRGDRYRDALGYVDSVNRLRALEPQRIVTGHFDPIEGADLIAVELTRMRDATEWIHDRTVEGMNAGVDVYTLMSTVELPDHLAIGEGYGKVAWNVRAIWETYAGWFHHRSTTELYGTPITDVAPDLVSAIGSATLVGLGRDRLDGGDAAAALHFTDLVLAADPGDAGARALSVDAHTALLAGSQNFWESAWLRREIETHGGTA